MIPRGSGAYLDSFPKIAENALETSVNRQPATDHRWELIARLDGIAGPRPYDAVFRAIAYFDIGIEVAP